MYLYFASYNASLKWVCVSACGWWGKAGAWFPGEGGDGGRRAECDGRFPCLGGLSWSVLRGKVGRNHLHRRWTHLSYSAAHWYTHTHTHLNIPLKCFSNLQMFSGLPWQLPRTFSQPPALSHTHTHIYRLVNIIVILCLNILLLMWTWVTFVTVWDTVHHQLCWRVIFELGCNSKPVVMATENLFFCFLRDYSAQQ